MTDVSVQLRTFLPCFFQSYPFKHLSPASCRDVVSKLKLTSFRPGEVMLAEGELPSAVYCVVQGRVRLLGSVSEQLPTLAVLDEGSVVGWEALVRRTAYGSVRAAGLESEVLALALSADDFEQLLLNDLLPKLEQQVSVLELYDVLSCFLANVPTQLKLPDLEMIASHIEQHQLAVARHWFPTEQAEPLLSGYVWFVSGGVSVSVSKGMPIINLQQVISQKTSPFPVRLIGIDRKILALVLTTGILPVDPVEVEVSSQQASAADAVLTHLENLLVPELIPSQQVLLEQAARKSYPVHLARSADAAEYVVACFWSVCDYLQIPYRPDLLRRRFSSSKDDFGDRMQLYARVADALGLQVKLVKFLPTAGGLNRLQTPALIVLDGVLSILYEVTSAAAVIVSPKSGLLQLSLHEVERQLEVDEVVSGTQLSLSLVLERQESSPIKQFGWIWFVPHIKPYQAILIQVLLTSIFVQLLGLANPLLTQQIIDKVIINSAPGALPMFGLLLVIFSTFEALLTILRTYLLNSTTNRVDLVLGTEIVRHLLNLPLSFFQKRPVGELTARISELENIRQFLTGTFLTVVLDVLFSVIYVVVMLFYSIPLTLCVLGLIPIIIGLTVFGAPLLQKLIRKRSDQNSRMQSYLIEILSGVFTVKAQHMEGLIQANWRDQYLQYLGTGFRTTVISTVFHSINNFINTLSSLLVLWVGGALVLEGKLTLGGLIAFRIIAGYVTGPMIRLSRLWEKFQETRLSMELLADIIDTPMEFSSGDSGWLALPPVEGHVQFEGVSFGFPSSGQLQLTNINLDIPAGFFVGLVGLSGSGKSTLVKLLPRLYNPTKGTIYIDRYDISKINLSSLRQQLGIVPQEPVLFDGTIRDNITLFCEVDDATVMDAAKVAEAHEFIMSLPNGYGTRVGERGSNLSGGQRQRVAIAQMVLSNPRLVILDEATSALDYETERRVCQNLMRRFQEKTVFFITHRLANLRQADLILYLQSGMPAEKGTHDELMALRQRYYCLYTQQVQN